MSPFIITPDSTLCISHSRPGLFALPPGLSTCPRLMLFLASSSMGVSLVLPWCCILTRTPLADRTEFHLGPSSSCLFLSQPPVLFIPESRAGAQSRSIPCLMMLVVTITWIPCTLTVLLFGNWVTYVSIISLLLFLLNSNCNCSLIFKIDLFASFMDITPCGSSSSLL